MVGRRPVPPRITRRRHAAAMSSGRADIGDVQSADDVGAPIASRRSAVWIRRDIAVGMKPIVFVLQKCLA